MTKIQIWNKNVMIHGKTIEYELLINLCLFSTVKVNGKKNSNNEIRI